MDSNPDFLFQHKLDSFEDPYAAAIEEEESDEFGEYEDLETGQHITFPAIRHVHPLVYRTVLGLAAIGGLTTFYVAVKLVNRF